MASKFAIAKIECSLEISTCAGTIYFAGDGTYMYIGRASSLN